MTGLPDGVPAVLGWRVADLDLPRVVAVGRCSASERSTIAARIVAGAPTFPHDPASGRAVAV